MFDLRFLYVTDLHGDPAVYRAAAQLARERNLPLLILGGDLLPKASGVIEAQGAFLRGFFTDWLAELRSEGREVWLQFGNDDCATLLDDLERLVDDGLVHRLDRGPTELGQAGFAVFGYPYVPEYPFGLKDWVKRDHRQAPGVAQLGLPVITENGELRPIEDLDSFFAERATIDEDLEQVPEFADPTRTVVVMHAPPSGHGLDVCWDGTEAGSQSVRRFLEQQQPLLALHGHIHESPDETGVWKVRIGETLAVQPGPRSVVVSIAGRDVELERIG